MRKRLSPLTLRLPFALVDRNLRLEQILAADPERSWAEGRTLLVCFGLSRPERRFARQLLARKRNIWLYRCNQRAFCGDFIAVDMSRSVTSLRTAVVMELKSGVELAFGGGRGGHQFRNARAAIDELATTTDVITNDTSVTLACGDPDVVLAWLETNSRPSPVRTSRG